MAKDWRLIILALYSLAVGWMMVDAGRPEDLSWFAFFIPFLAFAISPVAIMCLMRGHVPVKGIIAVVIALGGVWFYVQTMYLLPPDAQSALIFLVLPVFQWVAAGAALLAIRLFGGPGDRMP